jgi:hypothetical protein
MPIIHAHVLLATKIISGLSAVKGLRSKLP